MPILLSSPVNRPSRERFYEVDEIVRGLAFEIHNEFGRLLGEVIYKRELAARCAKAGLHCVQEFKITLKHGSYVKDYFVDLLIENSVPVELKTCECITPSHRSQILNYLYLTGLGHGILINMRALSVEHEFVSTTHTQASRREVHFAVPRWNTEPAFEKIRRKTEELVGDWGALLDAGTYRDALIFFMGGVQSVQQVNFMSDGQVLGQHEMPLLDAEVGWVFTSVQKRPSAMRLHLQRFLSHTELRHLAWINMNRTQLAFEILSYTQSPSKDNTALPARLGSTGQNDRTPFLNNHPAPNHPV